MKTHLQSKTVKNTTRCGYPAKRIVEDENKVTCKICLSFIYAKNHLDLLKKVKVEHKGYTATIKYSEADKCYHGKLENITDLVAFEGRTPEEAKLDFIEAVEDYIELKQM